MDLKDFLRNRDGDEKPTSDGCNLVFHSCLIVMDRGVKWIIDLMLACKGEMNGEIIFAFTGIFFMF